ncbi:MAG TPA: acyltransferase family protein [Methylophilaceae bacterium]|nr:acyltransferase family protein [Methylophilaceae bacterium]
MQFNKNADSQTSPQQSTQLTHPLYRADIDGLRALAIILVISYHAFPESIRGGFIGVDMFFVISGFLISTIIFDNLTQDSFSFVEFYSRRIKRIFPALIVVLVACYALGWFELYPKDYKQLGKYIAGGAGFISNFILWEESGYFDAASETKPMLHLWSLAIEEQFYIVWPLLLWAAWKAKLNWLTITISIGLISFLLNVNNIQVDPVAGFYSPLTRFWELLIGSVLAYALLYKQHAFAKAPNNTLALSGSLLIVLSLALITNQAAFPGAWALLPTVGTALIILAGSQAWLNRKILSDPGLVSIGLISYSIYLWHWPLLSFAHMLSKETPEIRISLASIPISIVLGWLTYQLVEKPIRASQNSKMKTITLSILMLTIGCIGYITYQQNGLGFRFNSQEKQLNELINITSVYEYFNYDRLLRVGTCHSVSVKETYINHCIEQREKNIFIWGDSYAASLYSGLNYVRNESKQNYGISQMTDGNGPPFFMNDMKTDSQKTLEEVNNNRLEAVRKNQPYIILITWMINGGSAVSPKEKAFSELSKTISKIKSVTPNSKIVILGPFPQWKDSLIYELTDFHKEKGILPAQYMSFGLSQNPKIWDDYFKANIPKLNVAYISTYDALCNQEGCLTRTSDNLTDITAIDWGHLTENGSIYLVEKLKDSIFVN